MGNQHSESVTPHAVIADDINQFGVPGSVNGDGNETMYPEHAFTQLQNREDFGIAMSGGGKL
jgi:hypothetical protein